MHTPEGCHLLFLFYFSISYKNDEQSIFWTPTLSLKSSCCGSDEPWGDSCDEVLHWNETFLS